MNYIEIVLKVLEMSEKLSAYRFWALWFLIFLFAVAAILKAVAAFL